MAGVSVAEKRALLEAAGEEWPVCECHGEPKTWHMNPQCIAGGSWICRIRQRNHGLRYFEANREKIAERKRGYYEANREANREKARERNSRRIKMFGIRTYVPDKKFREYAVQLREQRKSELANG